MTEQCFQTNRHLISSIGGYIELIEKLKIEMNKPDLWFRGVSKSSHLLRPRLYRLHQSTRPRHIENELLSEFSRRGKPFVSEGVHFRWQWYHLMQHYGLPTRLLDWTTSSLTALFFSVRNPAKVKIPTVWVLNPYWLNNVQGGPSQVYSTDTVVSQDTDRKIWDEYLAPLNNLPKYPIGVEPPHFDPRIRAQGSVFTVHGQLPLGFNKLSQKHGSAGIFKIRLMTKKAEDFKKNLHTMGVSESSVFPDLVGLSKDIEWVYNLTET